SLGSLVGGVERGAQVDRGALDQLASPCDEVPRHGPDALRVGASVRVEKVKERHGYEIAVVRVVNTAVTVDAAVGACGARALVAGARLRRQMVRARGGSLGPAPGAQPVLNNLVRVLRWHTGSCCEHVSGLPRRPRRDEMAGLAA